jgi:hypothetical protein
MSSWHIPQVAEPTYVAGVVSGAAAGAVGFWAVHGSNASTPIAQRRVTNPPQVDNLPHKYKYKGRAVAGFMTRIR